MTRHPGIVESIEGRRLRIRMVQSSGCAACGAKASCGSGERCGRLVEVVADDAGAYRVGDAVWVSSLRPLGRRAVAWAFGVPFVVLLGSLVLFLGLGLGEAAAGGLSLAVLIPYYIGLRLCRKRLARRFELFVTPA